VRCFGGVLVGLVVCVFGCVVWLWVFVWWCFVRVVGCVFGCVVCLVVLCGCGLLWWCVCAVVVCARVVVLCVCYGDVVVVCVSVCRFSL